MSLLKDIVLLLVATGFLLWGIRMGFGLHEAYMKDRENEANNKPK